MKTIQANVVVGGKHDGTRIETIGALQRLRLPVYASPCVSFDYVERPVEVCEYERTKFTAGAFLFTFWVPVGQDGAETMTKLLDGYNPKVTP
jgi:hypothetical protein